MKWKLIKTAPKDGSCIVIWCEKSDFLAYQARYNTKRNHWEYWGDNDWLRFEAHEVPSHWFKIEFPKK